MARHLIFSSMISITKLVVFVCIGIKIFNHFLWNGIGNENGFNRYYSNLKGVTQEQAYDAWFNYSFKEGGGIPYLGKPYLERHNIEGLE